MTYTPTSTALSQPCHVMPSASEKVIQIHTFDWIAFSTLSRLPVGAVTPFPALRLTIAGEEGAAIFAGWLLGLAMLVVDPGA